MVAIRSNLGVSVSTTYDSLTAFKKRITTCIHNWSQQKLAQKQYHQQQLQRDFKEYSSTFFNRTNESFKIFNKNLKKLFAIKENLQTKQKRCGADCRKVQIVAKLLSSTLIEATATTTTITTNTATTRRTLQQSAAVFEAEEETTIEKEIEIVNSRSSSMTITNDSFLEIRDEFPDLDAEVRSILMARAKEGATISDIRDDYRKNTGMKFPVYDNVTEFLLSIPSVGVICNEKGTRIFNVLPTEKTKHLFDLVVGQKSSQNDHGTHTTIHNTGKNVWHKRNHNTNYQQQQHKQQQQQYDCNINYNNNNDIGRHIGFVNPQQQQQDQQRAIDRYGDVDGSTGDKNITPSDSEGFVETNYCYQDNINYFFNLLCNQKRVAPPLTRHLQPNNDANNMPPTNYNNYAANTNNNNMDCNNNNIANDNLFYNNNAAYRNSKNIPNFQNSQQFYQTNHNPQPERKRFKYNNNNNYQKRFQPRYSSPTTATKSIQNDSMYFSSESDYEAHLLDFPLLGDDFFLYMARMELKCKFKKYEKILQSGLCVSGQSISAAIRRVRKLEDANKRVIVNIGSVDIMQGKPLLQIEHDFRELVNVMHKKGFNPILTTLAPLANYGHVPQMKEKLERFNKFIKRTGEYLTVIDIWSCLVNSRKQTLFDCFQNEPRTVTGASEPYVYWNKIGRQRVLQMIESKLEY